MATAAEHYTDERYTSAAVFSAMLHLGIVAVLVLNFTFRWDSDEQPVMANVIDAVVVDSGILEEVKEDKRREANRKKQQQLEKQRQQQEALRVAEKQRREAEEKKIAEQQRLEVQRQAEEAKKLAEQQRIEQERQAEAERQQRLEAERQAEAERQRQQQIAEEKRLLEEAQRAEWERIRAQEEEALAQARSAELATNKDLYRQAITQKVERNWIRPGSAQPGDTCQVSVQQIPGGEVVSVKIISCDGDAAFERSVENAVYKASPLPDPPDPRLFERNINFIFKPE